MQRMAKFLRLPSTHRHLLVKSVCLLGAIKLGLWLLPFRTLRRFLARMTQVAPALHEADQASIKRVVWAVAVASRYLPEVTCLAQALAGQVLLARRGHLVRLRLGVAKGEAGQLQAHAWVESQGQILIGSIEDLGRFTPLPPLEGEGI
jgi:hypothetical protein